MKIMALVVIPKKMFTPCLRLKLLAPLLSVQPYHCYPLSKRELRRNNLVGNGAEQRFHNNLIGTFRKYSSGSRDSIDDKNANTEVKKLSLFQRFKQMYRDYWYVLVPVHLVTSVAWFGGFYYLASSGVDIPAMLECMNFNEKIVNSMRNSSMGYFAITYGLYKIATPARYAVTLGGTTLSINYLTKWGYIKPMPSKERLREIYAETKEGMKEKRENLMESVHHLQQTVKETKDGIKEKKDSIVTSVKESKENIKNIKQKVMSSSAQKHENKP